jgi:putative ABC transport system ATP-binding protein
LSNSIEIKELNFSYTKSETILNISSLEIKENEKVFIFGPSGSGKSTLLNLIAGVTAPTSGDITILGENISNLAQGERDKMRGDHIGFIFQSFNLIPYLTIYENIIIPIKASKLKKNRLVEEVEREVKRLASHLKLENYLEKRVTQLSVGQQQRVAVARALIGRPEVVIADEPTSSLDDDVTDSFMKLLLEEHRERNFSLIFVSHDRRLAKYFDREISLAEINQGCAQ